MAEYSAFETQRHLIKGARLSPLRFPKTRRDLYQLLALYDPITGLDALLARLNCDGVGPIDVYRTVHQRAPDSIERATTLPGYDARQHLKEAMLSAEFRQSSVSKFLSAFPELRRDVFIHIPKCAGTDLILNLAPRRLSVSKMLDSDLWITQDEWLAAISAIAQAAPFSDSVFVSGHFELGEFIDRCGVRPDDRLFTIIRDPIDLIVSQANYAISRVRKDAEGSSPDTKEILETLGLKCLGKEISTREVKQLTIRALLDRRITQPNRICTYLGKEMAARYEVAMEMVVTNDVEIVTTETYSRWLLERWGIESHSRHNVSEPYLTRREVITHYAREIEAAVGEDRKFHQLATWALKRSGAASITGSEISKLFGVTLLDLSPASLITSHSNSPRPPRDMLAAEEAEYVALFLEPVNETGPSIPAPEFTLRFGADSCRPYLDHGWGDDTDDGFTRTLGSKSRIVIPRPTIPANYTLRMLVKPFLIQNQPPDRRVALSINGTAVGTACVRDVSILECDVDWELLAAGSSIDLLFTLQGAMRPGDVPDSSDSQKLGLGFEWLQLLNFARPSEIEAMALARSAREQSKKLPVADLMTCFESLGENCEFGLVQRLCGAEPLGLLRFSSSPLPKLLNALNSRFDGMGKLENIEVQVSSNGKEYMVQDLRFGFHYHAWVLVGEQLPESVLQRECRRVPFLIRKLREDLAAGEKIFIYHGMSPLTLEDALQLRAAIHRYGDGTLMWVELADRDHPPGCVEWIARGILKAYVERFAPGENVHDISLDSWVAVCRTAYGMFAQESAGRRKVA
jgi:hypothetical protein